MHKPLQFYGPLLLTYPLLFEYSYSVYLGVLALYFALISLVFPATKRLSAEEASTVFDMARSKRNDETDLAVVEAGSVEDEGKNKIIAEEEFIEDEKRRAQMQ
jgi:hypothetical protein